MIPKSLPPPSSPTCLDSEAKSLPPLARPVEYVNDRDLPLPRSSVSQRTQHGPVGRRRQRKKLSTSPRPSSMPYGLVEKPGEFQEKLSGSRAARLLSGEKKQHGATQQPSAACSRPSSKGKARRLDTQARKGKSPDRLKQGEDAKSQREGSGESSSRPSLLGRISRFLGLKDKKAAKSPTEPKDRTAWEHKTCSSKKKRDSSHARRSRGGRQGRSPSKA